MSSSPQAVICPPEYPILICFEVLKSTLVCELDLRDSLFPLHTLISTILSLSISFDILVVLRIVIGSRNFPLPGWLFDRISHTTGNHQLAIINVTISVVLVIGRSVTLRTLYT